MASGSSKGFDFASDDILCSYEDYNNNQEQSNPNHSDPASTHKEFNKSRMARTDNNEEVIAMAVERSVKKHTDNVMRFLEGLSSRLSQLELYCYNLDKSIGEMRSDLTQDHVESEAKLKFLEKHLQEVHRSVQILREKLELADTQKELAKLQSARKEKNDTPGARKNETPVDSSHSQQLALVPAPQPPPTQQQAYYLPPGPTPTQYSHPQIPPPQVQSVPQYQQHWTTQVQPHPSMQPGSVASRPSSPQAYQQYPPTNPSPEPHPNSMPMQMTYSTIPPPGSGSNQTVAYSYGSPVRTAPPPQQPKPGFGPQMGDGYPPNGYMVYGNGSGRVQHPSQGGSMYPPGQQHSGGGGVMARPPQQFMLNHPYGEVIDKLVSMGYRGDHVMSVIQRMDETGQPVDFNSVLDRLNGHSSGRI